MKAWGVVVLVLLVGLASAGEDEVRAKYEEHLRRGFEIVEGGDGVLSIPEIRKAAQEFSLAGRAAAAGGLHREAVTVQGHRVTLLGKIFDHAGRLDACLAILAAQEKMVAPAELDQYVTRMDVGQLHHLTGNPGLGIPYFKDSCSWFSQNGEPDLAAAARLRLADAYRDCGRYAAALREAEAAFPVLANGDSLEECLGALGVLGRIHLELGNVERAEKRFREGLRLTRKSGPLYRAEFHLALAEICGRRGDRKEAKRRLDAALGIFHRHHDFASAARVLLQMGVGKENAGAHGPATIYGLLARRIGAVDPYVLCHAGLLAGEAHLGMGNTTRARGEFDAALESAKRLRHPSLIGWAESSLAEVCLREEKIPEAVDHVRRSLANLERTVHGLSVLTATRARPEMERLGDRAVRVAFAAEDPAVTFDLLERSRACALVCALGGREGFRDARGDPLATAALENARAAIVSARDEVKFACDLNDKKLARAGSVNLGTAFEDYAVASDRIQSTSRSAVAPGSDRFASLADVRASLDRSEALVLYGFGGGRLHALVVRHERVSRHDLGAGTGIRNGLADLTLAFQTATPEPSIARLRSKVIDPLELGADVRRVLISPDGLLATMPLAALLPDREVAFVPSGTSRALLVAAEGSRGERVLALGDPVYSDERREDFAKLHRGAGSLFDLPRSRDEIYATTVETDRRLLGAEATEAGFRAAIGEEERWRAVHFACHGVVDLQRPGWSALAITPDATDDGYLAVAEILAMRIPADLAVLSACSTGVGKTVRGEGLIALPCAFLHAGTPRIIASLWKVDDAAARAMMTEFYKLWHPKDGKPGLGAAAALKQAQKTLREGDYRDPRHWAAWVLWGLPD